MIQLKKTHNAWIENGMVKGQCHTLLVGCQNNLFEKLF